MTTQDNLKHKLLAETAQCPFSELLRFFAQGVLLRVDSSLDLLEVGVVIAQDDTAQVQRWQAAGLLGPVEDQVAAQWQADDVLLWTTVIRPWILVQSERATPG